MWNEPSKELLETIPRLYETESIPLKEKQIHLHFFIADCDWYVAEFDGNDMFWGFAILNNDYFNAEWGYFCLSELKSINLHGIEIECELKEYFPIQKASEIHKICKGNNWYLQMVHEEN
jgi:hypothetical protein